ncbi:MAG: formylglycine-generating enzyme family protein, partial [Chitinophagales bacterium]
MTPSNTKTITLQHPKNATTFDIELIEVAGGKAEIGEREDKHEIDIPTFYIGKYPVTQALYEFVMGENPSRFQGKNRPVERVSWHDAKAFIQKLNSDFGGFHFRLPSESEWEYAARGGKHWEDGFEYAGSNKIEEVAWYDKNSHHETNPVGWRKPNQLGIHDMSGNVWEWCEDDYHSDYQNAPKDGSAWIDEPRSDNNFRVLRGGSWISYSDSCRVARRYSSLPSFRNFYFGLRLCFASV